MQVQEAWHDKMNSTTSSSVAVNVKWGLRTWRGQEVRIKKLASDSRGRSFQAGVRGFRASLVAQLVKSPLAMQQILVWFLNRKILWRSDKLPTPVFLGFPVGSDGKESTWKAGDLGFDPWVWNVPWRRAWQPTPVFLPGESHGQRSLVGCSP